MPLTLGTLTMLLPAPAGAQAPASTMQARAANAEFLLTAPPPPSQAAVCIVDSGVDLNPDTAGTVIERTALDGGTGDDVYTDPQTGVKGHGTYVAMLMGAPQDGWGMTGIWPHVRIASVRAMREGQNDFAFPNYGRSLVECLHAGDGAVKVIELAIGSSADHPPSEEEAARLESEIDGIRRRGINVVAGAGNDAGAVSFPARFPPVWAIGASTSNGTICRSSSRGSEVDLLAPGCALDMVTIRGQRATGEGTSFSSAIASAVLAALRSYRPDLSPDEAERLITSNGQRTSSGSVLDAAAVFRAADLDWLVAAAREPPGVHRRESPVRRSLRLPRPQLLAIRRRGARVQVKLRRLPRGATVIVRATGRTLRASGRTFVIPLPQDSVIHIRLLKRGYQPSPSLTVRPPRSATADRLSG